MLMSLAAKESFGTASSVDQSERGYFQTPNPRDDFRCDTPGYLCVDGQSNGMFQFEVQEAAVVASLVAQRKQCMPASRSFFLCVYLSSLFR